jgi:hypothetical protein
MQSTNATVTDNVVGGGIRSDTNTGAAATYTARDYNLCSSASNCAGANSMTGTPVLSGGNNYTTLAAATLASNSPGYHASSDASSLGVAASGATQPPPDTTAPDTTITSAPADPTASTSASIAFNASESGSVFECKLDAGAYGNCSSPKAYTALSTGAHTFSVRASDAAGNTDASPASRTWTINPPADTTAPDTTISSGPNGPTNDSTPMFAFTATEASSTFACRVDSGSYGACATPWTTAVLSDGSHTVSVRATDGAGNTDATPATRSFTVDTAAPRTTITSSPSALSLSGSGWVTFTVNDAAASSQCRLDAGAWAACTSPNQVSGLGIGSHEVDVRSTDAAGNVESPGASATWTVVAPVTAAVAAAGPTVTLTAPSADATVGSTTRLAATASSGSAIKRVEFWVDSKRVASDAKAPYRARVDLSSVRSGMHTVAARVFDAQGQAASTATLVKVSRRGGHGRAAAMRSSGRPAQLGTAAAGPDATQLAGHAPKQRMLQATLTRCGDINGRVVDRARLRADGQGHLSATRGRAGLCVLALSMAV